MLNNVPQSGQSLNVTRVPINSNFVTIDTAFSVNHVQYNDGSGNQGFHNFLNMPAATPTAATNNGTNQIGLYSKNGVNSGVPELYFQRNNLAANTGYAITEGVNSPVGFCRLPSGLLMKWGSFTAASGVPAGNTFTFPLNDGSGHTIPAFTVAPFQIQISTTATASSHSSSIYIYNDTPATSTQFTVYNQGNNSKLFYYLAIGI